MSYLEQFSDTYQLLQTGCLTSFMKVGETRIVLRSLSEEETSEIRTRSWGADALEQFSLLIAYSTQYLNGRVVGMEDAQWHLAQEIRNLPHTILLRMLLLAKSLRARVAHARAGVIPFSFEPISRELWASFKAKGVSLTHEAQTIWAAANQLEDSRIQDIKHWQWVKLLAAPHVGKEIRRRFDSSDKKEAREREEYRLKLLLQYLARTTGGIPEVVPAETVNGVPLVKDADDLVDEMLRWVRGEKDQHDLIVEAEKERIRAMASAALRSNQEKTEILDEVGFEDVPLVVLTPEEVEKRLSQVTTSRVIDLAPIVDTDRLMRFDAALEKARRDGLTTRNLVNPFQGG